MIMIRILLKRHHNLAGYFTLSWSPYAVVLQTKAIKGKTFNAIATSACNVFAKISFLLIPIMYAISFQTFRRHSIRVFLITRPSAVEQPKYHRTLNHLPSKLVNTSYII